jgi:hypothetical protein
MRANKAVCQPKALRDEMLLSKFRCCLTEKGFY